MELKWRVQNVGTLRVNQVKCLAEFREIHELKHDLGCSAERHASGNEIAGNVAAQVREIAGVVVLVAEVFAVEGVQIAVAIVYLNKPTFE